MRYFAIVAATSASLALMAGSAFAETAPVTGEVRKIDLSAGKITLRHGPIPNLDMDSMTMVFRAQDKTMLESVEVGDKVTFEADRVNGQLTVTKIEKAR